MAASFAPPNFFIVGAPRCGTTALSEYLRQHPHVCFSEPKESQYFCTDLPGMRAYHEEDEYLHRCFSHCSSGPANAIGDGSVWHLYSSAAIPNILRFAPGARFIIMVRNPIELCIALYEKWLELRMEDQTNFEAAWRLQTARRNGQHIPTACKEAELLQYGEIGKLGAQLQRAFRVIPPDQRLVLIFDDFVGHTRTTYLQVLSFLGLDDDGRRDFPKYNEGQHLRNLALWQLANEPPDLVVRAAMHIKSWFGIDRLNVLPRLRRTLLQPRTRKPSLSFNFRQELQEYFADDICLLSSLLSRDLSGWK